MRIPNDVLNGAAVLLLCAVGAVSAAGLPAPSADEWAGPSTLPFFSLGATAVLGMILIVQGVARRATAARGFGISPKVCAFFALWVGYMVLMTVLGRWLAWQDVISVPYNGGFAVATTLFLLVALPLLGRRRPVEILGVALGVTGILILVFSVFFKVQLP